MIAVLESLRLRVIVALLFASAAWMPVSAQTETLTPLRTFEAMQRSFPTDHRALVGSLIGKTPKEARRLAYAGIESFLRTRRAAILAAPRASLIALEAQHAAMLRGLERKSTRLCAAIGDRGFFSPEALSGEPPLGLDNYGVALVEAARDGVGRQVLAPPASKEDFEAWLGVVEKIEPALPVRAMLSDKDLRMNASPDHLCRGAVAMHEAIAALPPDQGERMARILLGAAIAP